MSKMTNKNIFFLAGGLGLLLVAIATIIFIIPAFKKSNPAPKEEPINGLVMLIEFERIEGILQWEKELDSRNLTALIKVQDNVLEEYPEVFKRLAEKGYEIAGGYDEAPFWDMSYEEQYRHLANSKELVEGISGKKMRVFGSRYFAYDENTLKAADALDIDYILGRGIHDVEAVVYQPEEYNTKVISVSNVDVGEMGRGSLCDYSLWARGSGADDFGDMIDESVGKNPNNMIMVSHSYLGGTRIEWWNQYERALALDEVRWTGFDDWMDDQVVVSKPNAEIEINREVKYVAAKPEKSMEEYEPIPGINLGDEDEDCSTDDEEMMCQ